jgi:hypothetical protein
MATTQVWTLCGCWDHAAMESVFLTQKLEEVPPSPRQGHLLKIEGALYRVHNMASREVCRYVLEVGGLFKAGVRPDTPVVDKATRLDHRSRSIPTLSSADLNGAFRNQKGRNHRQFVTHGKGERKELVLIGT